MNRNQGRNALDIQDFPAVIVTLRRDTIQTLLIDGNNLAHFLYSNLTPGQKMTRTDSVRLVEHLNNYARQHQQALQIEVCLDRSPGEILIPQDNLRVLWASYPQNGDDLLIDRFWFHHISHRACLVITNDDAILDEVSQAGGITLRVFDFVRRPGLINPVFCGPEELPQAIPPPPDDDESQHQLSLNTSIYFRIVEDPRVINHMPPRWEAVQIQADPIIQPVGQVTPQERFPSPPVPVMVALATPAADEEETVYFAQQAGEGASSSEPFYFLTLDSWPLEEGVRLLIQAFCPTHRAEYQDLLDLLNPDHPDPDDLRALAELLLHACAQEENFSRRGSLMTRVRLALLRARGEPVSLSALADVTGLKRHGLQGRIKAKAGSWIATI